MCSNEIIFNIAYNYTNTDPNNHILKQLIHNLNPYGWLTVLNSNTPLRYKNNIYDILNKAYTILLQPYINNTRLTFPNLNNLYKNNCIITSDTNLYILILGQLIVLSKLIKQNITTLESLQLNQTKLLDYLKSILILNFLTRWGESY